MIVYVFVGIIGKREGFEYIILIGLINVGGDRGEIEFGQFESEHQLPLGLVGQNQEAEAVEERQRY